MLELNKIYHGDNLYYLESMPDECVDLVYIDPPFGTQTLQKSRTWNEKVQGAVFYDLWGGGVHGYMQFLSERLRHLHRVLKPTGSLFLHLDWRMAHYAKVELDKIFGIGNFVNEVIWFYKTGGMSKRWLGRKHDTILWYGKSKNYTFNLKKEKSYLAHKYGFSNVDIKEDEGGFYTLVGMRDVWDIPALRGNQPEALGYPTQKPLALLERIVAIASNEDDVVLDCFCGCGTAVEAAHKLGREWIGIDASMLACKEIKKRMRQKQKAIVDIQKQVMTKAQFIKLDPFEFEKAAVRAIGGVPNTKQVGDDGVDGVLSSDWTPIQVKKSERIGRPVLDAFHKHIAKHKAKRGVIIALSFGKGIKEERARLEREENFDIQLLTLDNVIKGNYREGRKLL